MSCRSDRQKRASGVRLVMSSKRRDALLGSGERSVVGGETASESIERPRAPRIEASAADCICGNAPD